MKTKIKKKNRGFTLIELLVTIGILAVLATVVVLVLNPAELFKQARDSRRISDLATIQGAMGYYFALSSNIDLDGTATNCSSSGGLGSSPCTCSGFFWASAPNAQEQFVAFPVWAYNTSQAVDGTGWLPIDFSSLTDLGGSPLASLPIDPTNSVAGTAVEELVYKYRCDNSSGKIWYEINANMESSKYSNGGSNDVESTDGGNLINIYEVGNVPGFSI